MNHHQHYESSSTPWHITNTKNHCQHHESQPTPWTIAIANTMNHRQHHELLPTPWITTNTMNHHLHHEPSPTPWTIHQHHETSSSPWHITSRLSAESQKADRRWLGSFHFIFPLVATLSFFPSFSTPFSSHHFTVWTVLLECSRKSWFIVLAPIHVYYTGGQSL